MRTPATEALYAYWNEVRGDRVAPLRLEIEPQRIGDLLLDSFILERIEDRTYRFRLAGTRVSSRFGMDLRDTNFLDRWSGADRSMLEHHLEGVCERGRVAVFTAEGRVAGASGACFPFEILVLPLVHTGTAIDRLLCSLVPLEDAVDTTMRLEGIHLLAAETVWPGQIPFERSRNVGCQTPLLPEVRNARIVRQGRRQFRVYEGGLMLRQE